MRLHHLTLLLLLIPLLLCLNQLRPPPTPTRTLFSKASTTPTETPLILATAVSKHLLPFLENLRCTLLRAKDPLPLVFALDKPTLQYATAHHFHVIDAASASSSFPTAPLDSAQFGTKRFNSLTKNKLKVAHDILAAGYDLLFTDVDVVWCKPIATALAQLAHQRSNETQKPVLLMQNDVFRDAKKVVRFNTGFYYAQSSIHVIDMFARILQYAAKDPNSHINDQVVANHVMCKPVGNGREIPSHKRHDGRVGSACVWDARVRIESLPLAQFPNGGAFFGKVKVFDMEHGVLDRWCRDGIISAIHNNWVKGEQLKKERFQKHGMWLWDEQKGSCRP